LVSGDVFEHEVLSRHTFPTKTEARKVVLAWCRAEHAIGALAGLGTRARDRRVESAGERATSAA
jgi:hypothetical protein